MRKMIALLLITMSISGCSTFDTPSIVYDNLKIARDNLDIQLQIKESLLNAIDPQGDYGLMEAITQEKIEMEVEAHETAQSMNRIINYLEAHGKVDYMIAIFKFLRNDEQTKDLYLKWREGR